MIEANCVQVRCVRPLPVVTVILAVATLMICSRPAKAELVAISEADLTFFENKIRPLLIKHCVECHGEEEQSGELRLDQHARFQQGGSSGPVVEPGKPSASRLIQSVVDPTRTHTSHLVVSALVLRHPQHLLHRGFTFYDLAKPILVEGDHPLASGR